MTNELTTRYDVAPTAIAVTDEHIDLIRRTIAKDATPAELQLYLYDCQRHGVHPLDKLLHFTKRSGKYTPITSIDLLRSRAADTGELAGIDDATFDGEPTAQDFAAHVVVWRFVQGQRCPFGATARWGEYKPDQDHMWRKMPHLMLSKCAEALALRKAFPRQLAGLYTQDEMAQAAYTNVNPATGEILDAPKVRRQRTREELIDAIADLTGQAVDLHLDIALAKPLDEMSREELIGHGSALRAAIDQARQTTTA